MKIFLSILFFILTGCSPGNLVTPKPTGFDDKDFLLQAYIDSPNVAYCIRENNIAESTNGYICLETKTDNVYYVPLHNWEDSVKYDFELYARSQITELLDMLKNFCDKIPEACKETEPKTIKSLKEFKL